MVLVDVADGGKAPNHAHQQYTGQKGARQGRGRATVQVHGVCFVVLVAIAVAVGAKEAPDAGGGSADLAQLLMLFGLLEGRAWREEVEASVAVAVGREDEGRRTRGREAKVVGGVVSVGVKGRGETWQ